MDSIIIKNLEIFANHGVYKEENVLGQKFIVCAEIFTDNFRAGLSDNIDESIDYGNLCRMIKKITQENTFKLVERLAEKIARELLLSFEKIKEVSIEIYKPWAAIGIPLETAGVTAYRKKSRAYIGIGSNMGGKREHIDGAIAEINENPYCRVKKVADYIETEPYGYVNQDKFLNTAAEVETIMQPYEFLEFLNKVENNHGRKREIHWGPRTLDLDILLFGDEVISDERLCVPHIELCKREFVLKPLSQIAPYALHPLRGKTIADLYEELIKNEKIEKKC